MRESAGSGWRGLEARWVPWALIGLLLVTRGLVVLSLGDVFFYGEELEKGCATKAMIDGLGIPHHQLAYHPYEGGGFVTSHLNVPFFLALGPCVLALKVVSLLWTAGILLCGWRLCRRAFGPTAAAAFGLAFVLAPEAFQEISLLDLGIHFEATLFVLLALDALLQLLHGEAREGTWLQLGLALGFGTYFSYQLAPVALFCFAVLALLRPASYRSRASHWGWIGLLTGLLPLLLMWRLAGDAVFDVHGQSLGPGRWTRLAADVPAFLDSLYREASPLARVGPLLVPAALLGALALGAGRLAGSARRSWFVLLAFLAFETAVYLASGFTVGRVEHPTYLNRLSLVWMASLLVLAPALAGAGGARPGRLGALLLACACSPGVVGLARLVAGGRPGAPLENLAILLSTPGYDYPQYLAKIEDDLDGTRADKLAVFLRFRERDPRALQRAAALALADPALEPGELVELFGSAVGVDPREFLPGLAWWLRARTGAADPRQRLRALQDWPEELRPYLAEAVAAWGFRLLPSEDELLRELAIPPPPEWTERWDRALGRRVLAFSRLDPDRARALLRRAPPERQAALESAWLEARREASLR